MKRRWIGYLLVLCMLCSSVNMQCVCAEENTDVLEQSLQLGDKLQFQGEGFEVFYEITGIWEESYNVGVTIKNTGRETIHNWALLLFLEDNSITHIWNAEIANEEEDIYLLDNKEWNMDIASMESVHFGFTASFESSYATMPKTFALTSCEKEVESTCFDVSYQVNSTGGGILVATINIRNVSESVLTDWSLYLQYKNNIKNIWQAEKELQIKNEDTFAYVIRNPGWVQNIQKGAEYSFGFLADSIDIDAVPDEYVMKCYSNEIDYKSDSDNDLLPDIAEIVLGTNPYQADTDGDSLSDYWEVIYLNLNPFSADTDGDSISDGDEDSDEDGISNVKEMELMTCMCEGDTDEDGLEDGEELNTYHTNPLCRDTDGDGLGDGDEITLCLNPLKKDSDDNGILDDKEFIRQSVSQTLENINGNEIIKVEVQADTCELVENTIEIDDVFDKDTLVSNVVGLIGDPVEIFIDSERKFDNAKLKIFYDVHKLNGHKTDSLAVLFYDEKQDAFLYADNIVNDIDAGMVSCDILQTGKYMLIDRELWEGAWKEEIDYRTDKPEGYFDIQLSIDVSGSMKNGKLEKAKEAADKLIDKLYYDDRMSILTYHHTINRLCDFISDASALHTHIDSIAAGGTTDANVGLMESLQNFDIYSKNARELIMICDGAVTYQEAAINFARKHSIKVNIFLIGENEKREQTCGRIAEETGGKFYLIKDELDIVKTVSKLSKSILGEVGKTDTDGDGLPDVYEKMGMKISNGSVIYSDAAKADTDGDGLSDYEEIGSVRTQYIFGKNIKWFSIVSYPDAIDSDGDTLEDSEDACAFEVFSDMEEDVFVDSGNRRMAKRIGKKRMAKFKKSNYNKFADYSLSCRAVEKNLEKALAVYNIKKGNAKKIKKYKKNAKRTITVFGAVLKNATGNLKHFIGNTGEQKDANMGAFASSKEYRKYQKKNIQTMIKAANKYGKRSRKNVFYMYSNPAVQLTGGKYAENEWKLVKNLDLGCAVGSINAMLNAKIEKSDGYYTAIIDYYLIDCYDWSKYNNVDLIFTNEAEMYYLMECGEGKPYIYKGYCPLKITWKEGSKNYRELPLPGPAPQ